MNPKLKNIVLFKPKKNLFNKRAIVTEIYDGKNCMRVSTAQNTTYNQIVFRNNGQRESFTISLDRIYILPLQFYCVVIYTDATADLTPLALIEWTHAEIATNATKIVDYIHFMGDGSGINDTVGYIDIDTLQIETGIISTFYEPYRG